MPCVIRAQPKGALAIDAFYSVCVPSTVVLGIVVSTADEASVHIGDCLQELTDWTKRKDSSGQDPYWTTAGAQLREVEELHLNVSDAAKLFDDPDLVAFVSRHSGDTGPLLSTHYTGNFGQAEYGGQSGKLATAAPGAGDVAMASLTAHAPSSYEVSMECTHHGPSDVGAPSLFVELGSGPEEWADKAGAMAVARATLSLRDVDPQPPRTVVCIGGGHYAPRATRIARETDWAVGHIVADWALADVEEPADRLLEQLFSKSGATRAVVEGAQTELVSTITDLGYSVVSETWLRETTGVPIDRITSLESTLDTIEEGLRFGAQAPSVDSWDIVELPGELLDVCHAADPDRTLETINALAVAYETVESGNRVTGRAALPPNTYPVLIDELATLLSVHHDEVTRTADAVIVTDTVFDPDAARTLGVPEGPAFGRLADGEDVTIDGETIPAGAVHEEQTRRIPV